MLTPRQGQLLGFICECVAERGVSPSYAAMAAAVGQRSRGNVARLVAALEARGVIRRTPYRAHAIEPLCWPDGRPFNAPGSAYADLLGAVHAVLNDGAPPETLRQPYLRCHDPAHLAPCCGPQLGAGDAHPRALSAPLSPTAR